MTDAEADDEQPEYDDDGIEWLQHMDHLVRTHLGVAATPDAVARFIEYLFARWPPPPPLERLTLDDVVGRYFDVGRGY